MECELYVQVFDISHNLFCEFMFIKNELTLIRAERVERNDFRILYMKFHETSHLPRVGISESGRTPEILDEFEQRH